MYRTYIKKYRRNKRTYLCVACIIEKPYAIVCVRASLFSCYSLNASRAWALCAI